MPSIPQAPFRPARSPGGSKRKADSSRQTAESRRQSAAIAIFVAGAERSSAIWRTTQENESQSFALRQPRKAVSGRRTAAGRRQ